MPYQDACMGLKETEKTEGVITAGHDNDP
jgi:hypothetical protein